jgi:vacuolar-type H+-ATPase subunit I/STV1
MANIDQLILKKQKQIETIESEIKVLQSSKLSSSNLSDNLNDLSDNLNKAIKNKNYAQIIEGFTLCLYKNLAFDHLLTDELTQQVLEYDKNTNAVSHIVDSVGLPQYTCTNYCAKRMVVSLIKGEPYTEYLFNEMKENFNQLKIKIMLK